MRIRVVLVILSLILLTLTGTAQRTVKPALHGRHWVASHRQAARGDRGRDDLPEGRQRGRRRVRDARRGLHDVGHARLGRRDAGADLQPEDEEGHRASTPSAWRRPAPRPSSTGRRAWRTRRSTARSQRSRRARPGGLLVMLAEYGKLSLKDVLEPAIQMADGYAIEQQAADAIERQKKEIKKWPPSVKVFLTHPGESREAPYPGEVFKQADLAATLRKLVEAEQQALKAGKSRQGCHLRGLRPLLQGRHRPRLRRAARASSAACTRSKTSRTGRSTSRSRSSPTTRASRSTS